MPVEALNISDIPATLTIRQMRRDRSLAPGGPRFVEVARRFLPLVYGIAAALTPEQPDAAENISGAVFETLAFRWKRISRKTPLATWLVRTTWYVAKRERSRLGLKAASQISTAILARTLFEGVLGLSRQTADAFVLCGILGQFPSDVAQGLRTSVERVQKRHAKAVAKLTRRVHKTLSKLQRSGSVEAPAFRSYALQPAVEVEQRILARVAQWTRKSKKDPLVVDAISRWQWLAIGRFFKRVGATISVIVCVLAVTGITLKALTDRGYINWVLVFITQMQKGVLKEFPELRDPARPWPARPEEMALAATRGPKTSADLYGMTNIWLAKLKLTPDQWKATQPKSVPPARERRPDGKMLLRNPNASRSGLAGALGIDFPWSQGAFEFGEFRFPRVGVRFRGNGTFLQSQYGHKQSYKVDINRVDKNQRLAGETTLNFVNTIPDFSYVKDALAEKLFRELGAVAPRTAYAYLTINVPGKFTNQALGLYVLIEDIDQNFAKDRFGTKDVPIFKPVTYDLFDDTAKDWQTYRQVYDLKTKATQQQWQRVVDFARLVSHATDEEFAKALPEFLDLEEYAAFVAGHVLLSSYDGYLSNGQNFYMYLDPRSNKFGFIPWDQDHAWGEFAYVDTAVHRETASIWKPAAYKNKFLARVMKVEAFKEIYRRKLEQALSGPFTVQRLYPDIDALAAAIRPAVAAESDFRLKRFEIAVSTNWVSGPRDVEDFSAKEGPRAPAHQIKRFISARTQSVRDQLDGKAEGVLIRGFNE
jgi:DNA-directed RNA polymerase specialized sigma24 family protein